MLVKICGISNILDAKTAIEQGADAIGFVMGGWVQPPEVEPHAQTVRDIIKDFPKDMDSFIVTHLLEVEDILALAKYVNSTGIQVSEDIGVKKLKELRSLTKKKIIKTVVVTKQTAVKNLQEYQSYCDFILLDTRMAGYIGGTGMTSDWQFCKELVALSEKPVFLAGGLTPNNVKEGLTITKCQGADVSTGVSTYSIGYQRKDRKDKEKIMAFIANAKQK